MPPVFTKDQRLAIDTRDRTLLVSAAAGSGKTATLTERIIASLCDKDEPTDLSRLVIATFTKDAAADMKKKIAKALGEALLRDPGNERLLRQQLLLPSAQISTISGFCLGLLRRHAAEADLPPSFRVADTAEEGLLQTSVLEGLLEDVYAGECPEVASAELERLSEHLTSPKSDEGLSEQLLALYANVLHEPAGIKSLRRSSRALAEEVGRPLFETAFGREISERFCARLGRLGDAIAACAEETVGEARRAAAASAVTLLERAILLLQGGEEDALPSLCVPLPPIPRKGPQDTPILTDLYKEASTALSELGTTLAACRPALLCELLRGLSELGDILYRLLLLFDGRLLTEKRRRSLLGFLDIERMVYALLVQDGRPTELARRLSLEIDAIYLDEFQDVNALQYGIFRAIAREDNLFMVGDVKQCIYAFRHSDPHIFEALRGRTAAEEGFSPETVFFRHNFRSDRPIVSYVNRLAGTLLDRLGGYVRAEDDLTFAKPGPVGEEPVTTHVFPLPTSKRGDPLGEEARLAAKAQESEYVAAEIARLLREGRKNDGSPIRPSDILLLFRNRSAMPRFAEAIRAVAPARLSEGGNLFSDPEVLLALSLLHTVDNPRRDIYLAAALRSPVFLFTLSELVELRAEQKESPTLYDALLAYCDAHPDFEKGNRFLKQLARWRARAEGERVDELLLSVFSDAGLLTLGGEGTGPEHDGLLCFYEYARSFAGAPYRGLSGFISYISSLMEGDARLPGPAAEGEGDAVTLLTVHASKGLEAPVVFLCDTGHAFNRRDTSAPLLYDRTYGPVFRLLRPDGVAVDNPFYSLIAERIREEQTEEEARLLYVALTRARERLYVTGACAKPEEKIERAALLAPYIDRAHLLGQSSALSWILELLTVTQDRYLFVHPEGTSSLPGGAAEREQDGGGLDEAEAARLADMLSSRLHFVYPDEALTTLPEKLSVSRLSPAVLDGTDGEEGESVLGPFRPSVPRFLSGKLRDEAALRGTATHLFMQFADFARLTPAGIAEELARLVEAEFITREDAERVRLDEIATFCASPLFARIRDAGTVRRELRFHALLPASSFTREAALAAALGEKDLLVQGVIDCLIEEEDGYTVIDYKTDRLPPAELSDKRLAARTLVARHGEQLSYYAAACEKMYGKPPKEVLIYSLALGDTVEVCKEDYAKQGE